MAVKTPQQIAKNIQAPDHAFVSQIIDNIAIPMFILNNDHVITHWNKAIAQASGLTSEEMVGSKNQWKPFYSHSRPTMADLIIDGGKNEAVESFYKGKFKPSAVLENAYEAEDYFPDMGDGEWLSFTASPILNEHGKVVGAVETLVVISDRKKAEFELIQREQAYREMSIIDDLTQLFNSRHFYEQIDHELDRCKRYQQTLTLCLFDLDRFKLINDTYGHLFGNQVLETFGKLIKSSIRSIDTAYRYGGEEFIVLLPSANSDSAMVVADRIRETLSNIRFTTDDGEPITVTVSGGIATYTKNDSTNSLIHRADQAMYLAKENGRNQIIRSLPN